MNIKKIIDKLTMKINNNKKHIKELESDIKKYHLVQLDGIIKTLLKHSTYTYLALTLASIVIAKVVGITTIVNTIYPFVIPLVMGSVSLGGGTLSTIVKYFLMSNKLEKYKYIIHGIRPLTQEYYHQYQVEKANNWNKALFKASTTLSNNNITLPKDIRLEQINSVLEEKYQKLEELTKQHFYLKTKAKNNFIVSILKAILTVIISFITLILLYSLPLLVVNYSPVLLIPELAKLPFQLIGQLSLGTSLYSLAVSIANNIALNQLKYILNNEVNPITRKYEPLKITHKNISKLDKDIEAIIEDISNLEITKIAKEQQDKQLLLEQQARKIKQQRTNSIAPRGPINDITPSKAFTKKRVITGYSTKYKFDL